MKSSFVSSSDAARYVTELLRNSRPGSQLTITIRREKSGVFYVPTVITESLDGTQTASSSKQRATT